MIGVIIRPVSEILDVLFLAGITFFSCIFIYVLISLCFAFIIVQYKKNVIQTIQTDFIARLQAVTDRKKIIHCLTMLRSEGVKIRNRGESIMHQSGIDPWWDEHLVWRKETVDTIALLDQNLANQWKTLDMLYRKGHSPMH